MLKTIKNIYKSTAVKKNGFTPLFDTLEVICAPGFNPDIQKFMGLEVNSKSKVNSSLNSPINHLPNNLPSNSPIRQNDFKKALSFLQSYRGSKGTFNAYRRELERFFQWSSLIAGKSLKEITREDIEDFVRFCKKPPKSWIGTTKVPRFVLREGERIPNTAWRPFVVTVTKSAYKHGERPHHKDFAFVSIEELFGILSSFYNYLLQEGYVSINPVSLIRQKSKFIKKHQGLVKIRRLSTLQWQCVIDTAKKMVKENPKHHRTLFILSALYSMYLRISELAASERWIPQMNHFHKDSDGNWWFTTVGKGNKQRQIAVSDAMLEALKVWRTHLGLSPLPASSDKSPLLPKTRGKGPITHINYIRKIVQTCFDQAIVSLKQRNLEEDADALMEATVHWLRHTGISDDVKVRPREHVRDDAGHSSSAITDKYIDIELKARHQSARNKGI